MGVVPPSRRTPSRILLPLVTAAMVLVVAACGSAAPAAPVAVDGPLAQRLTGQVTVDATVAHLDALQGIADRNGGNRAAGTPGYEASVEYVAGVLRDAGLAVDTPTYSVRDDDGGPPVTGRNVVAQTRGGDPDHVVMVGAHLDSVPEGPGIVDNGSGVATLLEIATRLGAEPEARNAVRFAFFGNEETEAEGSTGYVEGLSAADRKKIALYLNVDMVASANGGYLVQGGVGGDTDDAGPTGSAAVARVLADQLTRTGVKDPETIEFYGDDESAFAEAGVPVGGAVNGDEEDKTGPQATAWGGRAGVAYDPCYHQACDRVDNVNREVLDHYLRAVAGTVAHFATSPDELR